MDLWVMAAAVATGYIAKYWRNVSREEGLSESFSGGSVSRPFLEHPHKPRPRIISERVSSAAEIASTSGFDCGRDDPICLSEEGNKKQVNESDFEGNDELGDTFGNRLVEFSIGELGFLHGSRSRSSIISRRPFGCSVKPVSSLESCLVAQLYKENVEMEEYVLSSFPSLSTLAVRPLLVTDGSRIINRSGSNCCSAQSKSGESKMQREDILCPDENKSIWGEKSLSGSVSMQLPKRPKQKRPKRRHQHGLGNFNVLFSDKQFLSQGSPDGMLLFFLGVTVGVISTVTANKREVDKLNELLKQTKNFVQDLQEELEMKDSLTVKELANEGYDSQETNDHSFHNQAPNLFSSPHELDKISNYDVQRPQDQNSETNSDSMSKLEAELEVELERLELNMNASSLDGRFSGRFELDQDLVVDVVQGELRADRVNRVVTDSERDASGESTNQQNINYAVSPRELSLRLHEVIQSRLEERINELENALQNSQRRLSFAESNQTNSWKDYSNSEKGYSSQETPSMTEENDTMAGPLFLNLSGDALDAYNEAYEEFSRPNAKDEEDLPFMAYKSKQFNIEKLSPVDHGVFCGQNGGEQNGSSRHLKLDEERDSITTLVSNKIRTWEEKLSGSRGSSEIARNEDKDEDDDGQEMAHLLKQVLEKTRQGSPLVLNAQSVLFSMD